jgi:hypothetical protein
VVQPAGIAGVDSPPFRGGQGINRRTTEFLYLCTSAFVAYSGSGSTKNYVILTAGHCGPSGAVWYQADSVRMGTSNVVDVNGTDGQWINVANESTNHSRYVALGPDSYRVITSSQGQGADVVGQTSCITGRNFSGLRCGEILNRSFDIDESWASYTWGRELDADCNGGDSGGPALYGNQARGIISAKIVRTPGNDTCVYTHIYDNLNQLGLTAVRTT